LDVRWKAGEGEPTDPEEAPRGEPDDPLLGTLLAGRFKIESLLGEGGMGRVYGAVQAGLDRRVAVKTLHAVLLTDARLKERFHREARAAARLRHPGVAEVYDFGEWEGRLYIAMEFLEGRTLAEVMEQDAPLPRDRIVLLLGQVLDVLELAHEAGILHRDLKPANIIVVVDADGDEQVKVVDFGLARLIDGDSESRLTRTGAVMGTPTYMSPEQCRGEQLDSRSDLYSIGVILYEMLCGLVPFESPASMQVMVQHMLLAPEPPSLRVEGAEVDTELELVALRALAKERDARPQSAAELREALRAGLRTKSRDLKLGVSRDDRADTLGIRQSTPWQEHGGQGGGQRVAVVEPPGEFADSLTAILRAQGYAADRLDAAADLHVAFPEPPEAVVFDLGTDPLASLSALGPTLDGGRLDGLPVVVAGPADSHEAMAAALRAGLAAYVPSGNAQARLPKAVRKALRRARRGKADTGQRRGGGG